MAVGKMIGALAFFPGQDLFIIDRTLVLGGSQMVTEMSALFPNLSFQGVKKRYQGDALLSKRWPIGYVHCLTVLSNVLPFVSLLKYRTMNGRFLMFYYSVG